MSVGGPSGIGGPKGPGGPTGLDGPGGAEGAGEADAIDSAEAVEHAENTADIDRLAAEVAAGKLTPKEAIDQLVEATATPDLSPAERAELRELLADIVANDPYFGGLADRV